MAPLRSDLEAQHRLDIRQNAPQLVPITLTIHRATTTFTTRMNLGEATNSPVSKDVTAFATPIASPDPIVATRSSDPSDNTGVVIGALIGVVFTAGIDTTTPILYRPSLPLPRIRHIDIFLGTASVEETKEGKESNFHAQLTRGETSDQVRAARVKAEVVVIARG
ncbi:hypothetical protein WAI453_008623 [Rhynchosporium graminicola]